MTDPDEDDLRAYVRDLFSRGDTIPADVVPGSGPTREDYIAWNAAVGTASEVSQPGEPLLDADGIPNAMPPPVVSTVYFGGVAVTVAELQRVGLTPDDVPKLQILGTR